MLAARTRWKFFRDQLRRHASWELLVDGIPVVELLDRRYADMFWDQYRVCAPDGASLSPTVFTNSFWHDAPLVLRYQATGEVVDGPFAGEMIPTPEHPYVNMRSLAPTRTLGGWGTMRWVLSAAWQALTSRSDAA